MGVDPRKFETVKFCLEALFTDVTLDESIQHFFIRDGKHSSELVFARVLLDDIHIHQLGWLKAHMAMKVIPALKTNLGKKISVNNSGIHIREIDIV